VTFIRFRRKKDDGAFRVGDRRSRGYGEEKGKEVIGFKVEKKRPTR
jgi:hypothetical protein